MSLPAPPPPPPPPPTTTTTPNPLAPPPPNALPPAPKISLRTLPMAGLLVDVYGLAELPPAATRVSCLWLHHPRTRRRDDMADMAARCVGAWNEAAQSNCRYQGRGQGGRGRGQGQGQGQMVGSGGGGGGGGGGEDAEGEGEVDGGGERGLVALAYDQRNHGGRLVDWRANGSWREGNPTHALDMFGVVAGMVADQRVLLDLVEGYLFHQDPRRKIDQHLALGVSLGGHSVWQLMFAEPRVTAGVVIIGCPDYISLLSDRARLSKLPTYSAQDDGASFLGSKDFPPSLLEACRKSDPKAIVFGTSAVPTATASGPVNEAARQILHDRLRGKSLLLCSGGDDKLVPYRCSEPFLQWLKQATGSWFKDENVSVDDRIYPGIGHEFSADMVKDSVQFVLEAVARASQGTSAGGGDDQRASKI